MTDIIRESTNPKPIVVIYGPPATGKTMHGAEFLKHYGCLRVVEEDRTLMRGFVPLHGDLILTTETARQVARKYRDVTIVDVDTARIAIGLEPAPAGGFRPEKMGAFYYSTTAKLEDAEHWFGPHASRMTAALACRARFPDVGFWTAEGSAQTHRLDVIDQAMLQPDGCIGEAFDEINAELIGEGGEGGSWEWTNEALVSLVHDLNAQFAQWAQAHGYQRGWTLDVSAEEWTPALQAEPAATRERPTLSLIGGGR
jgi:hypothetical protein